MRADGRTSSDTVQRVDVSAAVLAICVWGEYNIQDALYLEYNIQDALYLGWERGRMPSAECRQSADVRKLRISILFQ